MAIYDITYSAVISNLLPPQYRTSKMLAWLNVLIYPLQWLRDKLFGIYIDSKDFSYNLENYWDGQLPITINSAETAIRFYDNSVWISLVDNIYMSTNTNNPLKGQTISGTTEIWYKLQDDCIGFNERKTFNNQKIKFEYLLNRYFPNITGETNLIYIYNINTSFKMFEIGENEDFTSYIAFNEDESSSFISETDDENEVYNFIIYVPTTISTLLGAEWSNKIRTIADKYNFIGLIYDIQSY